ncbi:restriction endonuclease subunit S [Veillonella sp.]|uniref:restriction endonuclease subunit S n=1 Tax=Veillonella sp. TaxID=1926307 RepID=UPI002908D04F|nr:restriction endonuclease subunit S [Veillonella sp.]MDU3475034.1 restriction endonuclease subunit S [Veillonella sp.]MDU3482771.1 restriction endonuclease subunit S [Veillonella sp.]
MSKKDNVAMEPKYRFPEFLNCLDWKKEELNKLGKVISGLTYSPQDIREDGLLVLRSSNIKDNVIDLNDTVYVRSDVKGYTLTEENDILICVRNGSKSLIGKNALIPEGMPLCTNGAFMIVFRANNPCFAFQLFQSKQFDKQVKADLGATINSINSKQLKKYIFAIPQEKKEQEKIADCLSSIDDLISAEERKLSLLNEYKKGWMQKLFPSEEKTVPEWRFPEFKDRGEWKEKKLGEVCNYWNGKSHESKVNENGEYYLITLNSIDLDGNLKSEMKKITYTDYSLKKNDLIMVLSDIAHGNFLGLTAIIPSDRYVLNQRMGGIRIKDERNVSPFFICAYINYNQKYFKTNGQGSSQLNLSKSSVMNFLLLLPSLPEQQKIANFLSGIDELISRQKDKIEELKQHKEALIQGLFPSIEEVL